MKIPGQKKKCIVVIYQYNGYNGGFAQHRKLLWKCVVIGNNGKKWDADHDSWHGTEEKRYAANRANEWSKFTGWPIWDLGRQTSEDDRAKDER